jgi:hypothetical protein
MPITRQATRGAVMTEIRHLRIAHNDRALVRSLGRLMNNKPEKLMNEDLSQYQLKDLTMANLAHRNMIFMFHGPKVPSLLDSNHNSPEVDELLFSHNSPEIYTSANTCASYMLFCENTKLLASSHIASRHLVDDRPSHMMNMLMFGYANLKRLAPGNTISAYISGMHVSMEPLFNDFRGTLISSISMKVLFTVMELMARGVDIRSIDIGDRYKKQIFSPMSGSYYLEFPGNDNIKEIICPA